MTVAITIFEQLGGAKFVAMTGAKQILNLGNGLQFNLGRNKSKANRVTITLRPDDLYDIRFSKSGTDRKTFEFRDDEVVSREGIFADNLREVFTDITGLETSL